MISRSMDTVALIRIMDACCMVVVPCPAAFYAGVDDLRSSCVPDPPANDFSLQRDC